MTTLKFTWSRKDQYFVLSSWKIFQVFNGAAIY